MSGGNKDLKTMPAINKVILWVEEDDNEHTSWRFFIVPHVDSEITQWWPC